LQPLPCPHAKGAAASGQPRSKKIRPDGRFKNDCGGSCCLLLQLLFFVVVEMVAVVIDAILNMKNHRQ